MMEMPNTDALRIPSARLWLSRRKKVTVMGTMGNTHGVIKAAKPARNATIRSAPKELVPYDASPSKIEGSRIGPRFGRASDGTSVTVRSEEHTSELQSRENLVCRLLLEKKKK